MKIGVLIFDEPPAWISPALIDDATEAPRARFAVVL